ncbi:helix-turn-helix domain-containing protein [Micromonospora sp. KC721]|uniref:helix-turn-helix domain-containing protein n=1 Tax=Micromonospora sp. KC721 TaxID=2530380 RepID=UPI001FB84DDA|nr:helix-turn-helix domain-containing protein [Micromonospora sp. KC721]
MTPEKVAYALHLLGEPDRTMTSIAKLLGVSRSTLYTALPELQAAKRGLRRAGRRPRPATAGLPARAADG